MIMEQNELRARVTALITLLLGCHCAHTLTDGQLYIKSSCEWSYQIKGMYNVTTQDLGSDCQESSDTPSSGQNLFPSEEIYQLKITPVTSGRAIKISWDYQGCYTEFFVKFEASFQPSYLVDNSTRKCIQFTVKRLPNKLPSGSVQLHFNCLRINSKDVGTLSIQNYGKPSSQNNCPAEFPVHSYRKFDLGCGFHNTVVGFVGKCLVIEFLGLHTQTDFKRTSIKLHSPEGCIRKFSGTDIARFNGPGILHLPVYENGTYSAEVKLVCNTFGEVDEKTIHIQTNVTNASACPANKSTNPSTCSDTTAPRQADTSTPRTSQSTIPLPPPYNQLYTVITVVSGIGIVGLIVILVFKHRQRQQESSGEFRARHQYQPGRLVSATRIV